MLTVALVAVAAAAVLATPIRAKAGPLANSWQVVANPQQSSFGSALDGVSCWSPGDCVAVGTSSADAPLIESSNGGTWTDDATPTLPHGPSGALSDVSCPSSSFCIAVGGTPSLTLVTPPSGQYLEVASDGGIFSFAPPGVNADFYGSMGGQHLNGPVVGIMTDG